MHTIHGGLPQVLRASCSQMCFYLPGQALSRLQTCSGIDVELQSGVHQRKEGQAALQRKDEEQDKLYAFITAAVAPFAVQSCHTSQSLQDQGQSKRHASPSCTGQICLNFPGGSCCLLNWPLPEGKEPRTMAAYIQTMSPEDGVRMADAPPGFIDQEVFCEGPAPGRGGVGEY